MRELYDGFVFVENGAAMALPAVTAVAAINAVAAISPVASVSTHCCHAPAALRPPLRTAAALVGTYTT